MKLIIFAALFVASVTAQAFEIKGKFELVEPCKCFDLTMQKSQCPGNLPGLHVFSKSVVQLNAYAEGYTDGSNQVWYFGRSVETVSEFVIKAGDAVTYDIEKNGREISILTTNMTNPQTPFPMKLEFPTDQAGGVLDGPARLLTLENRSSIRHAKFTHHSYEGPTPLEMVTGTQTMEAQFSMDSYSDGLIVRSAFVHKAARAPSTWLRKFNESELICKFKPVR